MSVFEQISKDIMAAMKARETIKLEALRAVKKEFIEAKSAISATAELADDEALKIIQKLVKQRRETAVVYSTQGREDLASREVEEADYLAVYLPIQLSADEIATVVKKIISDLGITSQKEMGKVMGAASKALAGKADGKLVADVVKKLLVS